MGYGSYGTPEAWFPEDIDRDGDLTFFDVSAYNAWFNASDPRADFARPWGTINFFDQSQFQGGFNSKTHGPGGIADEGSSGTWNRIGYAGSVWDPVAGLWLSRHRHYEPEAGRWLTPDPAGYVDGLSLYLYVRGNPITLVDPTGLTGESSPLRVPGISSLGAQYRDDQISVGSATHRRPVSISDVAARSGSMSIDGGQLAMAAVEVAAGFVPGVGEAQDVAVLADRDASVGMKVLAGVSLAVSAATLGMAPNAGTFIRAGNRIADAVGDGATGAARSTSDVAAEIGKIGSYTNYHQSGITYHGKGSRVRSQESGRRVAQEQNDPHVATDWTTAPDGREAFKDEARRIESDGGVDSTTNYNKINSPGKKYIEEDE